MRRRNRARRHERDARLIAALLHAGWDHEPAQAVTNQLALRDWVGMSTDTAAEDVVGEVMDARPATPLHPRQRQQGIEAIRRAISERENGPAPALPVRTHPEETP